MAYFLAAFGLLFHVLGWGVGAAWLVTPRRHWHFWPLFVPALGLTLQSIVVWVFAAHTEVAGTDVYARWSEVVPLLLLVAGWMRVRRRGLAVGRPVWRTRGVWVLVALVQAVLVAPFTWAATALTSLSLGSCDAADYAAGARVFMEFSHGDRGGFMGLTEVVGLHSVDNFFDFWLRLNHFTPSALMALNASVFGWQAFQVVSVFTTVLLAVSVPAVVWMARGVVGHGERGSVWIAALYGFNPITWYAVYHGATAQLIAAVAIALVTWAGVVLWRAGPTRRNGVALSGLLFAGYALILGAYNFILLVCLVPAVAFAGGLTLRTGEWRRLGRWAWLMLTPLVVAGAVFFTRVAGLWERLLLFREADIGWHIRGLAPSGWLGVRAGPGLHPIGPEWQWAGSVVVVFALIAFLVAGFSQRGQRSRTWAAVALTAPILVGYGYLWWRGKHLGTNASYDAYKLFAVFYVGMLPAFCGWLMFTRSRVRWVRWSTGLLALAVSVGVGVGAVAFLREAADPPLKVDRRLAAVQQLEGHPEVTSINLEVPDFWERLWANQFLLRRAQYFHTYTYEGRRNTPMRGEWELNGHILRVVPPKRADGWVLNERYAVIRRASPSYLQAELGTGWHGRETRVHSGLCWQWTSGNATIAVGNPHAESRQIELRMLTRSLVPREVEIWANGQRVQTVNVGVKLAWVKVKPFAVPPGATTIELRLPQPAVSPGDDDPRLLGILAEQIELRVQPDAAGS
ncbi:hypothetical protein K0B96_09450 [Horticoccus luteus]|uniref:Uncharacterized protein n=1 Tax=Horticoccus luteus TaxID=2862869 RepID=A0A8F9TTL8_9BACT|nr:hypothetical protein [Horticoccus luteus]QYM77553.1 hypothetical protein K0B96_09450 [Horticoccus luteus]